MYREETPAVTFSADHMWCYSSLTPTFPNVTSGVNHTIRAVRISLHIQFERSYPVRLFLVHIRNWDPTQAGEFNPFLYYDSPLSTTFPSESPAPNPISFGSFYDAGNSGNVQVVYDKVFQPPYAPTQTTQPQTFLRLTVGKGYDISFTDKDGRYGLHRWCVCAIYSGTLTVNPSFSIISRIAYTNVGG